MEKRARTYALTGFALLLFAALGRADEVSKSALEGPGDAFAQLERLAEWAAEVGAVPPVRSSTAPVSAAVVVTEAQIDPFAGIGEAADLGPLVAPQGFSPRVLGSGGGALPEGLSVRGAPKSEGIGGSPKVKFGERSDLSLQTIAKNNAAAVEAITQAGATATAMPLPFTMETDEADEGPAPKSFEERLEELSAKEAPFYVRDYVEYRTFVAEYEERVSDLPNRDSRFHDNLKRVLIEFGEKDGDRAGVGAIRRALGLEADHSKSGSSKRRTGRVGRTH